MTKPSAFRFTVVALLGVAALLAAPAVVAKPRPAAKAGPGCDPARLAVAHRAGGVALSPQPDNPPIPCETVVGPTTESADVGVGRSGAVFYAPLNRNTAPPPQNVLQGPERVVRSQNGGATWTALDSGGPTTGGLVPPWMSVDPRTSRIWFATTLPSLCGARISWSNDDGRHWHTNPSVGCPAQGANKVLEGPPPASGPKPAGYPHVVYYCSNGTDVGASTVYCYKSLDGGRAFTPVGGSPDPQPPPGCMERHPARAGVVGPNGILYFPTSLCGVLGIAASRDEGATWQHHSIGITGVQDIYIASIAVDARGNLYIAWLGQDDLPHLTISRDRGRTWTKPIRVAAPGVEQVRRVAITARRPGQIALAYLGTTDGSHFNGYITESASALARRPLYWSAAVNNPAHPLVNGSDSETFGDRFFYGTDVIARDGAVWAGFHCAKTAACPDQRVGVVGRLTAPSNRFRFGRLVRNERKGTATLRVKVPGAGKLALRSPRLKGVTRRFSRKATAKLPIRATGKALRTLRRKGRLNAKAKVTFTPTGGSARTEKRAVTLVRQRG